MRFSPTVLLACVGVVGAFTGRVTAQAFTPIDLSGVANGRLQNRHPEYPSGVGVLLGGVPFNIAATGPNTWFAANAANGGPGTVSITVPVNQPAVRGVHTLINTLWGVSGTPAQARLRFDFSDGSSFTKQLVGDADIRDYYDNVFTNTINGTTTQRVFFTDTDGPAGPNRYRLDKQYIDLSAFSELTLLSMTLTDQGNQDVQRTFLAGLTVQPVPEPGYILLVCSGAVGLVAAVRRRVCQAAGGGQLA